MKRRAFTMIELVIAIAVIAMMTAVAVPAYSQTRIRTTETTCAKNRKLMQHSKMLWMIDHEKSNEDEVLFRDLIPEYIPEPPVCPMGGNYMLNGLVNEVSCTKHGS